MKHLFALLSVLMLSIGVLMADNIGRDYYDHVVKLYNQGEYEKAKQGFMLCLNNFKADVSERYCNEYIQLCDKQIAARRAAALEEKQATEHAAAAVRAAHEAKWQKRINDRLIYVSSDAYIFDTQYSNMHRAIKGYLSDAGFEFTDDPELAYWSVYVTAVAYELNYVEDEGFYRSAVDVCVKIVNEIDKGKIVYENELPENIGTNIFSYAQAARNAYQKNVNKRIGELVVSKIKK